MSPDRLAQQSVAECSPRRPAHRAHSLPPALLSRDRVEGMETSLLLLLSRFSRVRLCDPIGGSPPGHERTTFKQATKTHPVVCHVTKRSKPGANDPYLFIPQICMEHPLYARYCPRLQRYGQWPQGAYIPLVETKTTKVIRNCKHSRWK